MGSIELGRPLEGGGDSCSDEDENSVLSRAERDQQQAEPSHPSPKWTPRALAFCPYALPPPRGLGRSTGVDAGGGDMQQQQQHFERTRAGGRLTVVVSRPLVTKLTKDILETYLLCDPNFKFGPPIRPKRFLTHPSTGVSNGGQDNVNSDLILYVNGELVNYEDSRRYIVKDMLGQGTFGQVCKCWTDDSNAYVAIKVIKNQPAYYQQAHVEISICHMLNNHDLSDGRNIVRILDHFVFSGHLCLVFELLGTNLYELLKLNHLKGLSMMLVRRFTKQMLDALAVLRESSVIHCDLKPENILLQQSVESAEIKLIDFGSACMEHRTVYSYIQSRFYRSPEVVLLHQYTTAIDMWSLGCVAAELFLGLPLFPGTCEYDLLLRMTETLGCQPPDHVLRAAKNTSKFFKLTSSAPISGHSGRDGQNSAYHFLSEAEFEAREKKKPQLGKRYFMHKKLEDIIMNYPLRRRMSQDEVAEETEGRLAFIDFLKGILHFDPLKRWTPGQAVQHPFLTEESFVGPFKPQPEKPRSFLGQAMAMDHNPVSGHWFGAGLSPKVNGPVMGRHSNNQSYHTAPFSYASSISSVGSFGSEGPGFGSSVGSHNEPAGIYFGYPGTSASGVNSHNQGQGQGSTAAGGVVGVSPETYRRMQMPNIPTSLGVSPSGFRPSLGASPSHNFQLPIPNSPSNFHASPNSNFLASPASYASASSNFHGSPAGAAHPLASPSSPSQSTASRHGGPLSPARIGQSALGKMAHYNNHSSSVNNSRRRTWLTASASNSGHNSEFRAAHWQRLHQQNAPVNDSAMRGGGGGGQHGGLLNVPRRHNNGASAAPAQYPLLASNLYAPGSLGALLNSADTSEAVEDVLPPPDPKDWDPSYSDDLLFEGTSGEASSSGVTAMDLSEVSNGVSRLSTGFLSGPNDGSGASASLGVYQHGHAASSGDPLRQNWNVHGPPILDGEAAGGGSLQNDAQGQQHLLRNPPPQHAAYTYASAQISSDRLGPYPAFVTQQQWAQIQPHPSLLQQHFPDASSSSTDASYCQTFGGFAPDGNCPAGLGFHVFPASIVPNVEHLPHHLADSNYLYNWGQMEYAHPHHPQNLWPHEPYTTGRRPGASTVIGRQLPPTAPGNNYGSKRSI